MPARRNIETGTELQVLNLLILGGKTAKRNVPHTASSVNLHIDII